jgi:hypothetical protein
MFFANKNWGTVKWLRTVLTSRVASSTNVSIENSSRSWQLWLSFFLHPERIHTLLTCVLQWQNKQSMRTYKVSTNRSYSTYWWYNENNSWMCNNYNKTTAIGITISFSENIVHVYLLKNVINQATKCIWTWNPPLHPKNHVILWFKICPKKTCRYTQFGMCVCMCMCMCMWACSSQVRTKYD